MRHVGILAHSFEGAGLCFRTLCLEGVARLGPHMHPQITITCSPMGEVMDAWEGADHAHLRAFFAKDVEKLAAAGADFFLCPDNTAHIALESEGEPFALPGLHIAETVADEAQRRGFRKVGILGTKYTMTGPVYAGALGKRGIAWAVPDPADQRTVNDIIFDELCLGHFTDYARGAYAEVIDRLAADGCDSVALVCTEIPLLVRPEDSPLPTLDSTRLLAKAALAVAVGDAELPKWRGGAVQ